MSKLKHQHYRSLAIACLACTGLVLLLHLYVNPYRDREWKVRDGLAKFGKRSPASPDVIFLAIDNISATQDALFSDEKGATPGLKRMEGGFPFPRDFYALVIEQLVGAGARVVAFDMLFPSEKDTDGPFREAIEKYADKVVIGANLEQRDQGARAGSERIRHALVPPSSSLIPPPERGLDHRAGFVNFWPDPEGLLVRKARYRTTLEEINDLPPEDNSPLLVSLSGRILEKMGRANLIPSPRRPVMFRFAEDARPFPLYEMFVPNLWAKPPYNGGTLFRDKVVIIGPDGNWVKDELETPFGLTNGPRIHLSTLNAALAGDFLYETSPRENFLLILLGGLIAWLLGRGMRDPLHRFGVLVGLAIGLYGLAQILFNAAGIFPIVLSPLLALVASGATFSIAEQVLERREKTKLRKTFERYVSKDVVKELVDNPEGWLSTQEGQRKPITVLFSDLRGFTTLTESADPHELVKQLNEYFDDMVEIVFANKGTLDKFIGDAVMAHWGSITSEGVVEDSHRAVSTAIQMRKALALANPEWKKRGMLELQFGIGVNMGEAIIASLGSKQKAEVSAIGDAVNLASRLEGVTKNYHIDLCIGENVATLVRDAFILRSLDSIVVKGKTHAVKIFAVLDECGPGISPPPWLPRHEEAVKLYRAGDFPAAETAWREVLAQAPSDRIAEVFIERCAALRANPPAEKWTGVFEMKSK